MHEWMTLEQAAAYLQVSKPTLYRWLAEQLVVAYELPSGRGRRFKRDELDQRMRRVAKRCARKGESKLA